MYYSEYTPVSRVELVLSTMSLDRRDTRSVSGYYTTLQVAIMARYTQDKD